MRTAGPAAPLGGSGPLMTCQRIATPPVRKTRASLLTLHAAIVLRSDHVSTHREHRLEFQLGSKDKGSKAVKKPKGPKKPKAPKAPKVPRAPEA
jgi:hypothetical protein